MAKDYEKQRRLAKGSPTHIPPPTQRSVAVRLGCDGVSAKANRAALAKMSDFERITGRTPEDFQADMATQRASCLARVGITPSAPLRPSVP